MEYTKNLNLNKPSYDDDVDVQVLNNNMDILDDNWQRTNAKMNGYLPLAGGTMKGNINIPYGVCLNLNQVDTTGFIEFNTTTFNNKVLPTLKMTADRLKFYCPNGQEFVVDDTGAWFNGNLLIRDLWTENGWHSGYTKLSTKTMIQWGYVNPTDHAGNVQHVTFQAPFANPQYAVVVSKSNGTSGKPSGGSGDWWSATYNFTTTGFDVICDQKSYGHTVFWIAIGRGVK